MNRLNSLSLFGWLGEMVMEVITGGKLVFDWISFPCCPSQDIFIPRTKRRKKMNEKGEIFIFFANISKTKRVMYSFPNPIATNKRCGITQLFQKTILQLSGMMAL